MSVSEELARLAQLRDQGILSEEEFQAQKAAILQGPPPAAAEPAPKPKASKLATGCGAIVVILVILFVIGVVASPGTGDTAKTDVAGGEGSATPTSATAGQAAGKREEAPSPGLFGPRANAARSARAYLEMSGFSRQGLIDQLTSDAGDGYNVADATAAVDSLGADWNAQAARSAKDYLDMTGFSCAGLIDQLSSDAGSQYTRAEARFGATQAGAC